MTIRFSKLCFYKTGRYPWISHHFYREIETYLSVVYAEASTTRQETVVKVFIVERDGLDESRHSTYICKTKHPSYKWRRNIVYSSHKCSPNTQCVACSTVEGSRVVVIKTMVNTIHTCVCPCKVYHARFVAGYKGVHGMIMVTQDVTQW